MTGLRESNIESLFAGGEGGLSQNVINNNGRYLFVHKSLILF